MNGTIFFFPDPPKSPFGGFKGVSSGNNGPVGRFDGGQEGIVALDHAPPPAGWSKHAILLSFG
jgi:hypothetical protein